MEHLPEKTGMAFVLVQHLDPMHSSALEEILSRKTKISVMEVTEGMAVERDHVYVMPANADMIIKDGLLRLSTRTVGRGQHRPIDTFFHSLAEERGDQAIGVILSGTASDGTSGCGSIKEAGGITFAQDETTAKYASMPHSAVAAGAVDFVLSPQGIAEELARIGKHPYIARALDPAEIADATELAPLFSMMREARGVDFAQYKKTTLHRRIKRRMVLNQIESFKDYIRYVTDTPRELDELYREILIHVTGFFRDAGAFEALQKEIFPNLLKDRKPNAPPIRIWVPGCSTGEEAYSLAIALMEYLSQGEVRRSTGPPGIQIFATDISDDILDKARAGLYGEAQMDGVSPARLRRFFTRVAEGYQVQKAVREVCVFARQNVTKDPPFSNLDLISCRNLLIYLGPELQKRVIPALHYGLKAGGYLLLGSSESLGAYADYFTPIDKKYRIYQKKKESARLITYFTAIDNSFRTPGDAKIQRAAPPIISVEKEVERQLANRFLPASIVLNSDLEIVQFRGKTGAYLEPAEGHPTFSLAKMAREGLLVDLRAALNKAKKEEKTVRKEGVRIGPEGQTREVDLEVMPIVGSNPKERYYVVAFQERRSTAAGGHGERRAGKSNRKGASQPREAERLMREVRQLRAELQTLIEDHEETLGEFKTANEEVLSSNEELQSTNEELETAKEELQSSNEELTTVNEELQTRNTELSMANNDLLNLLANVNIPVVMVTNDIRIRRFTPPAQKLLNLLPGDVGRKLGEIRPNLEPGNLDGIVRETIDANSLNEREVRDSEGTWFMMRARPYKTWDNRIDGAVISFEDINTLKRSLEETKAYADTLIENARESILVLDSDLRVLVANRAFYGRFGISKVETENRLIYKLGGGEWNIPALRQLLNSITKENTRIDDFEVRQSFQHIGERIMVLNARRIEPNAGEHLIFLSIEDVTEKWRQNDSVRTQGLLLDLAHDAVMVRDMQGTIQYWNRGAEETYGWKKEEALGKTTHELLHTEFPIPFAQLRAELERNGHWEGELAQMRRDGQRRFVSSRWALMPQREGQAVILEINSDVTEEKHSQESLRQLSGHLMRVQDEERRRIARDLHDSTGQKLAAARMFLDSIAKTSGFTPIDKRLLDTMEMIDGAFQDIRTLSHVLHPPLLDETGLVSATRSMVNTFSERAKIPVEFLAPAEFGRLPQPVELALFRVIQESLTNIHRHSGAKEARIELAQTENGITLEVRDNGRGLPPELLSGTDSKQAFGVGILGMKERLTQLGGELKIKSGKNGTVVKATVQIKAGTGGENGQQHSGVH